MNNELDLPSDLGLDPPPLPRRARTFHIEAASPGVFHRRRLLWAGFVGLLAATLGGVAITRPPKVEGPLWTGRVEVGELRVGIGGHGKLTPSGLVTLSSPTGGSVETIHVLSGTKLQKGDAVVTLRNPDLLQQMSNAEKTYSDKLGEQASLQSELVTRRGDLLSKHADAKDTLAVETLELNASTGLAESGIISRIQLEKQRTRVAAAQRQVLQAEANLKDFELSQKVRSHLLATAVEGARSQLDRVRRQVDELTLRAGESGVLYDLMENITVGMPVAAGTVLAKVATRTDLSAELQVPSIRASEIALGQVADLQVGERTVHGRVDRIDPRVQQDQVRVSILLDSGSSTGLLPGQPVGGNIITTHLADVLHVHRPVGGAEGSVGSVFVVDRTNRLLVRREVRFGLAGGRDIVVDSGLAPGTEIVLGDLSKFNNHQKLRYVE